MSICCGKIDETMKSGKLKALVYFVLFIGYFAIVTTVINFWSIFRKELNTTRKILTSLFLLFLWETRKLTIISPEKKAKISGRLFRFSPSVSGFFFRHFDTLFILSSLSLLIIGIYVIIKIL